MKTSGTAKFFLIYTVKRAAQVLVNIQKKSRQIYQRATFILQSHAVFMQYFQLKVILLVNAGTFTRGFACRTPTEVYIGLPGVHIILLQSQMHFFLIVASNFTRQTEQTACNSSFISKSSFFFCFSKAEISRRSAN